MTGLLDNQSLLLPCTFSQGTVTHSLVERCSHTSQHSLLFLLKLFVKYYFESAKSLELFLIR